MNCELPPLSKTMCFYFQKNILIVTKHHLVHTIFNAYSKHDQNMSQYWNQSEHWHLFDCFYPDHTPTVYNVSLLGVFCSSQYVSCTQLN